MVTLILYTAAEDLCRILLRGDIMYKFIGKKYINGIMVTQLSDDKVIVEQFLSYDAISEFEKYLCSQGYFIDYLN